MHIHTALPLGGGAAVTTATAASNSAAAWHVEAEVEGTGWGDAKRLKERGDRAAATPYL